jgi:hypothetical protein
MSSLLAVAAAVVVVTGCATANLVESEPGKKVVVSVSPQSSPEARSKALEIARAECNGKNPVKVKEGRVVVGSQTSGEANQTPQTTPSFNILTGKSKTVTSQSTSHSSTTTNTYEWHVTFECQ